MAKEKFTGVKGMNDMLPQDAPIWQYVQKTCVDVLSSYGYQEIRTPILENTRVFTRGVGEVTDIVEKEMYSFTDSMNGDQLTLRPECTSAVVRAVNEHNLLTEPRSAFGTAARCSVMNARSAAATVSSISSALKRSAWRARTLMPKSL